MAELPHAEQVAAAIQRIIGGTFEDGRLERLRAVVILGTGIIRAHENANNEELREKIPDYATSDPLRFYSEGVKIAFQRAICDILGVKKIEDVEGIMEALLPLLEVFNANDPDFAIHLVRADADPSDLLEGVKWTSTK